MNNFSTTQVTNYAAFAGIIVMISSKFGFEVTTEEVLTIIGAGVAIYGVGANFYNRYKKGDVTLAGKLKE